MRLEVFFVVGVALVVAPQVALCDGARPESADRPGAAGGPELTPTRWEVKAGAPPGVGVVLRRVHEARRREYEGQLRVIEAAESDLKARRAGRVVKELKAPDGFRAMAGRGGGREYAFQTPQVKGREVVKGEAILEHAKRRLAEIGHPDYLAKPLIGVAELKEGAAGMLSLRVVHQVSGTEAVTRVEEETAGGPAAAGRAPAAGREVYLSDFPARDYPPGLVLRDYTIEVVGTRNYQGQNGRVKTAVHAKPLEWRKWVEVVRRAEAK